VKRSKLNRREFLKSAGACTAAGLSAGLLPACRTGERSADAAAPRLADESSVRAMFRAPPALFRPTPVGCTVHWVPETELDVRVAVGAGTEPLESVREVSSAEPTSVVLDGLTAGGTTRVQCLARPAGGGEWLALPTGTVRAGRSRDESFRVALIADSHVYAAVRNPAYMANLHKTNARVLEDRPDFVIFLGDEAGVRFLADPPGFMNQREAENRWRLWRDAFAPLLSAVPSFMVLGNHEGEAGYYVTHRQESSVEYLQRWGTVARKRYYLNPGPDTYPEGGENERWSGDPSSPATGGAEQGNRSPFENYYAWTWGDALFVVLDVHRYTKVGGTPPASPEEWTLGTAQLRWVERVLGDSTARWIFVVSHHLVGGYDWDLTGSRRDSGYAYGRGGGRYARVGEQAILTDLMRKAGARFWLYGHDHVFAHQRAEEIDFVCCGRPTFLQPRWWSQPGWKEAYGEHAARNPVDFHAAIGYTRLEISPEQTRLEYIRTGTDPKNVENVSAAEGEVVYAFSAT